MSININPSLWGPSAWRFMHYVTLSYPDNPTSLDKNRIYNFFMNMKEVLPCEKCRYNFGDHLQKYPLNDSILSSKFNLTNWLLNIHNEVNTSLGKPVLTYDQLLEMLSPQNIKSSESTSNNSSTYMSTRTMIIIFIIVLILILLLAIKFKNLI